LNGSLNRPYGVFMNYENDALYIADSGNNRIILMDLDSQQPIQEWTTVSGSPTISLYMPTDVSVSNDDNTIIVADTGNGRIVIYTLNTDPTGSSSGDAYTSTGGPNPADGTATVSGFPILLIIFIVSGIVFLALLGGSIALCCYCARRRSAARSAIAAPLMANAGYVGPAVGAINYNVARLPQPIHQQPIHQQQMNSQPQQQQYAPASLKYSLPNPYRSSAQ